MIVNERYISDKYFENNPTWHVEDSSWKARQILKMINKHNLKPNSLCEIGCGAGEVLHQLFLKMDDKVTFSPILQAWTKVGHIHCFSKETALEILKETEYEIIDYFFTAGALEVPSRTFRTQFSRLARRIGFSINPDLTVRMLGGYSLLVLTK